MQADFVKDLFTAIKSAPDLSDLTCFIDSNGMLDIAGWQNLLPVTDGVMLDIKAFAMDLQKELTGHDTSAAQNIARVLLKAGKLYEIRYLLIPGKTDNTAELDQLVAFIQSLGLDTKVRLNAFQHHGVRGLALDQDIMPKEGVDAVVELLADEAPDVAYWSATLIGRLGERAVAAVSALCSALEADRPVIVRERAAWALGRIGQSAGETAIAALNKAANESKPRLSRLAQRALDRISG